MLIKERQFLSWSHNSEAVNARAFTDEVEDVYARAYEPRSVVAGRVRVLPSVSRRRESKCRIFETKVLDPGARRWRRWQLRLLIGEHLRNVATDVRAVEIRDSGHWVAEEAAMTSALVEFLPPPE
jgi:hypothetical protein